MGGFYSEEDPSVWSRTWILMWAYAFVVSIAMAFFMPAQWWVAFATLSFGLPEAVGLLAKRDPYPPLTYVIRYYLPRWAAFTGLNAVWGALAGYWAVQAFQEWGYPAVPFISAALFGLHGWINDHFTVTFAD